MATLAATIIIEGTKFTKDSELLKSLKLNRKLRANDTHKIGRPNLNYYDALSIRDEVFVSNFQGHTILCSDYIPSDFIGGFSTLKTSLFQLFPDGKKVVFFSNSTSLLNGFIIFEGQKLLRMKVVQDGKIEKISNDSLDFGDLLEQEKQYYKNQDDPKLTKDYLWGIHDLQIAIEYINDHFHFDDFENSLEQIVFNKYTSEDLTEKDLSVSNRERLSVGIIHDTTHKIIKKNFTGLIEKNAKDDFPSVSRVSDYYLELSHSILNIRNKTRYMPPSGTNSDISFFIHPKSIEQSYKEWSFFVEGLGFPILNYNAHEILIKEIDFNERIVDQYDLDAFVEKLNFPSELIQSILSDTVEDIFTKHDDHFVNVFEQLKSHSARKGWIQGYTPIRILLTRVLYELKRTKNESTYKVLTTFFKDFKTTNKHFIASGEKNATKNLQILNDLKNIHLRDKKNSQDYKAIPDTSDSFEDVKITTQTSSKKENKPKKWWQFWK